MPSNAPRTRRSPEAEPLDIELVEAPPASATPASAIPVSLMPELGAEAQVRDPSADDVEPSSGPRSDDIAADANDTRDVGESIDELRAAGAAFEDAPASGAD